MFSMSQPLFWALWNSSVIVNGKTINDAYDVDPAVGKILMQTEGFEIFVRRWEIRTIGK